MEYRTSNIIVIKSQKIKLLENNTVQWFLFGDPFYIEKKVNSIGSDINKDIEMQARSFLFGANP